MISNVSTNYSRDMRYREAFSLRATEPLPIVMRSAAHPLMASEMKRSRIRATRSTTAPRSSSITLVTLMALFTVLNLGDVISTYIGLHSGMHEGNPLMSALLMHYGFGALIAYKLLVVAAVSIGVHLLRSFSPKVAFTTAWICNGLVFLVVLLNIAQFLMSL